MTGSGGRGDSAAAAGSLVRRIAALARLPLAEAASEYAASGVAVFPCVPGQKRPLTEHGLRDASTDPQQVAAWWRRWPMANVGLPTGQVSGLDVLDVDVRPTGSGFEAFERLRDLGLARAWAMLVRTPSGGLHAYFPAVPGRPQRCWQSAAAHLDFRGDGGYVLAPPSVITGPGGTANGYVVTSVPVERSRPLDADRVRELLIPRPERSFRAPSTRARGDLDVDRLAAWVAGRPEGERNSGLFWAACRLTEHGFEQAEIGAALTSAAANAGLPPAEIAATIRSAARTVEQRSEASRHRSGTELPRSQATSFGTDSAPPPRRDVQTPAL